MHSDEPIKDSVDIVLSSPNSKDILNAIKPSSYRIFGYKTSSSIHKIE